MQGQEAARPKNGTQLEPEEDPRDSSCVPFSLVGRPARQAVAHAAGAITAATADTIIRADLLTTLAIFGKLAYGQLDVIGLIGREHMKESALYAEIGDEARVETAQADVLTVLEERFGGQAAASCRDAVKRVTK